MIPITHPPTLLTLPLTRSAQATALQLANQQPTPEKAAQIRRNCLAVQAVNDYCQMMAIATNLAASDLWHPLKQLATNPADLELVGVGRLECRPIAVTDRNCWVPAEVWADRIGYVAVQLDEAAWEATLLGFLATVTSESVPLSQFQPIETLIDRVHLLTTEPQTATQLSRWLTGELTAGWQTVESLLDLLQMKPAFAFRSAPARDSPIAETVRCAKLMHLSTAEIDYPLAFVIELLPRSDGHCSVWVQIHTVEAQAFLPSQLHLTILDQADAIVLSTEARSTDDYIQVRFRGLPQELFQIQVSLHDSTISERFVI